jgi:enamine deaminase RidA (YjgF/YER057c/UK114 family)
LAVEDCANDELFSRLGKLYMRGDNRAGSRKTTMKTRSLLAFVLFLTAFLTGCAPGEDMPVHAQEASASNEAPEYFLLRPEVEKAYGYTHAIRIGDDTKISGAVSMDDEGILTAAGDMEQQMKNAYANLDENWSHQAGTNAVRIVAGSGIGRSGERGRGEDHPDG